MKPTRRDVPVHNVRPPVARAECWTTAPCRYGVLAALVVFSLVAAVLSRPRAAEAHPLGNFTITTWACLELRADRVEVAYAQDMAEIPTFQEMKAVDQDRDGQVSPTEQEIYHAQWWPGIAAELVLRVDGTALTLQPQAGSVRFTEGQGGSLVLRLDATFSTSLPVDLRGAVPGEFADRTYANRLG